MGKLKKGVTAVGGVVIGLVTLRALRKRRSGDEEIEAEVEKVEAELQTATEHAAAAVEHAGIAAKKAIKAQYEKTE